MELVDRNAISNQEELRQALAGVGVSVTQATLSRDLRELGIIKQTTEAGMYKYARPGSDNSEGSILKCQSSGNLIVLKTSPGMAPVYAYRIDDLGLSSVLGTVAGEDTLFAVVAEDYDPKDVRDELCRLLRSR